MMHVARAGGFLAPLIAAFGCLAAWGDARAHSASDAYLSMLMTTKRSRKIAYLSCCFLTWLLSLLSDEY